VGDCLSGQSDRIGGAARRALARGRPLVQADADVGGGLCLDAFAGWHVRRCGQALPRLLRLVCGSRSFVRGVLGRSSLTRTTATAFDPATRNNVYWGATGSATPAHYDSLNSCTWNLTLKGIKRWLLLFSAREFPLPTPQCWDELGARGLLTSGGRFTPATVRSYL
jgi:hypothetical protein